jgi:hypothetical protein
MKCNNNSFHADRYTACELIAGSQNRITMQAFAGYEHDTDKINRDKCDPHNADRSLWNELSSLLCIYEG